MEDTEDVSMVDVGVEDAIQVFVKDPHIASVHEQQCQHNSGELDDIRDGASSSSGLLHAHQEHSGSEWSFQKIKMAEGEAGLHIDQNSTSQDLHFSQPGEALNNLSPSTQLIRIKQEDIDDSTEERDVKALEADDNSQLLATTCQELQNSLLQMSVHNQDAQATIQELEQTQKNLEHQIVVLTNESQLDILRYNNACNEFRKEWDFYKNYSSVLEKQLKDEKIAKEKTEDSFRSHIAKLTGQAQKEKERAKRYEKMYADMIPLADNYTVDTHQIESMVKDLRYEIRNWVLSQRLILSPHPERRAMGRPTDSCLSGEARNPDYGFLNVVTPHWIHYTIERENLEMIIQAYVWNSVFSCIFHRSGWVVTDTHGTFDFETSESFEHLQMLLKPRDGSTRDDIAKFHDWRCSTARLLVKSMPRSRQTASIQYLSRTILYELLEARPSLDVDIEDFGSIVEAAVKLGKTINQQRAHYKFDFFSASENDPFLLFQPQRMTEAAGNKRELDDQRSIKGVDFILSPAFEKHEAGHGTAADKEQLLMKAEVVTFYL